MRDCTRGLCRVLLLELLCGRRGRFFGHRTRKIARFCKTSFSKNAGKFSDIESENLLGLASCFYLGTHFDFYALSAFSAASNRRKCAILRNSFLASQNRARTYWFYHRGEVVLVSCDFSGVEPEKLARVAELMQSFSVMINLFNYFFMILWLRLQY